jgi:branched-chain amino acid transport system substrate-binding protein
MSMQTRLESGRWRSVKVAALALTVAATLVACDKKDASQDASAANELVVTLGSGAPLTGNVAHLGKDHENGIRLAIEDLNAKNLKIGGKTLKLKLISEDDQGDPRQATLVAQKLIDDKVAGVIGHVTSGPTITASQRYHEAGIPQISPSATNPQYTLQGFKNAFRVMANDIQQGAVLGTYAVRQLGAKRVAIIDDRTAYGQGLADQVENAAKAAGAKIVAREYTKNDATDFRAQLTSVKAEQPDLLFYGGMDAQGGPLAKQAKQLGMSAKLMMGDGGCSPEFIKLAGEAAEGAYCSQTGLPLSEMPKGVDFEQRFKKRFGTQVQIYAPYAYDAVYVLVDAMLRADSADPAKYLPEIAKTNLDGVSGHIEFDSKGDLRNGAVTVYQVHDGALKVLEVVGGSDPVARASAAVQATAEAAKQAGVATIKAVSDRMQPTPSVSQ